jgi:hypothetical protein
LSRSCAATACAAAEEMATASPILAKHRAVNLSIMTEDL